MSMANGRPEPQVCPICFTGPLEAFNSRPSARCATCGSLERGRLAWMTLSRLGLLRPGVRFLNLAPEPFMFTHGRRIIGDGYVAGDFDPVAFPAARRATIVQVDLCRDALPFSPESFDVVMHSHVLEHVVCDVSGVIRRIDSMLAPGGWHILSIPISGGPTEEDLSELSAAERQRRFGQHDHVRRFGSDVMDVLRAAGLTGPPLDLRRLFDPEELRIWGIPASVLVSPSGHSVFAWQKPADRSLGPG